MADEHFRTVSIPLPYRDGLHRTRRLLLELIHDWTVIGDPDGRVLPPQEWPRVVRAAMVKGFVDDEAERARLVLRMLAASAASSEGDVLARAFQVNEGAVIGLSITIAEPAEAPGWTNPRSFGPTLDEIATDASAEPAVMSSKTLPRYLRLARDLRSGGVSWALVTAIAAEEPPDHARNPSLIEASPPPTESAEVWLRYDVPVPHSPDLVTLTFCGYGDAGFGVPLAEASRRMAALAFD